MGSNRLSRLAVGIAIAAVACNGSTSAAPSPSPSPTAAAPSPSPSPSPAPSPSPTEVLPANDVDDPVAALEAIVAYHDRLFERPELGNLSEIYAKRCECYGEVEAALEDLANDGQHLEYSRPRRVEVVEIVEREGPFARIRYREDSPGARLVSANGQTIEEAPDEPEMYDVEVFLVREGGRWLVVAYA